MERLFRFLYTYRAFFTFLILEFFCAWLIVENNQYQSTKYFNSSNRFVANINAFSNGVREYFSLRDINSTLAEENAKLRKKLEQRNLILYSMKLNHIRDTAIFNRFDYVSAKVVNNSTKNYKNFITINRGLDAGLKPGMAVISANQVVGKVKSVSDHFSVLISLLNVDNQVSVVNKRTGHFGTVQWIGSNPLAIDLKYIPRHATPSVGDSIITSGYNTIFPEGIFVGRIKEFNLNEHDPFFEIKVELGTDFTKLAFVEVIKSHLGNEREQLEKKTIGEPK
jgi:rod shape-determining protein MreC